MLLLPVLLPVLEHSGIARRCVEGRVCKPIGCCRVGGGRV